MSNKTATSLSLVILVATIFGFIWLFAVANTSSTSVATVDAKYQTVDLGSIKKDITDVLAERQNVSGMPISEPVNKMGKENPFSALQ